MSTSSSGSSSFFFSSAGAAPASAAPLAAGPAAGPEPTLVRRAAMSCPSRALAKRPGQYGSTSLPLALMILFNLSAVMPSSASWRRRAA